MAFKSEQRRATSPSRALPSGAGTLGSGIYNPMGFDQTADNDMYNQLRNKVVAEERERRISQGLSPDPPNRFERFKKWFQHREDKQSDVVSAQAIEDSEIREWHSADKRSSRGSDARRSSILSKKRTASDNEPDIDVTRLRASVNRRSVDAKRCEDWWA